MTLSFGRILHLYTHYTTILCVFFTCLLVVYLLVLLVCHRMYLIRKSLHLSLILKALPTHASLTTSSVPVYFTNTHCFYIFMLRRTPLPYASSSLPNVLRHLPDLARSPTSRAFAGISSSLHRHPINFTVQHVYRSLIIHLYVKTRLCPLSLSCTSNTTH